MVRESVLKIISKIIPVAVVLYLVYISYPKIQIEFYTQYSSINKIFYSNLFNISMKRGVPRDVCFRITNIAEPILTYFIPASNTKAYIISNIECDNCDIFTGIGRLDAQISSDACRTMEFMKESSNITMSISVTWNGLGLPKRADKIFFCNFLERKDDEYLYFCKLIE